MIQLDKQGLLLFLLNKDETLELSIKNEKDFYCTYFLWKPYDGHFDDFGIPLLINEKGDLCFDLYNPYAITKEGLILKHFNHWQDHHSDEDPLQKWVLDYTEYGLIEEVKVTTWKINRPRY